MAQHSMIAILPARGGSKRFPRKNIALLAGKPLLTYPLRAAQESQIFSRVFVSTEDAEISDISKTAGAEVHNRKEEFATDTAHELDACLDLIADLENKGEEIPTYICVIYPTAVFIDAADLINSARIFEEFPETQAIMSVSGFNYHPYKSLITNEDGYLEMMYPVECKQRSQTYPHLVASNGTFYWLHVETLQNNRQKSYYQANLKAYEISYERAVDIDHPEDLEYAELLMKTRKNS